ncbi:MAG: leucine-rich repeat protein [Alistipes sp.]|nr:leucine-rich repeat protein [Alistipes sp.]
MKRYILTLLAVVLPYFCAQAQEHSIEIDASSFAAVQTDMISGVAIDKIGKDHSNRECARIKMRINRMTAAEIGELSVRPRGGNVEVMKCVVANEGNGLIIELTAKEPTTFYITHPKYGDSNVVSLNLEGSREYKINAELNISYPIFVNTNIVGADVYIDNLYMGRTNENYTLTAKDIQPGTHLLRLVHGNSSTERQIEVTGDNLDFRIEINTTTSRPQYVVFHVEPHSAVVLIDNKNYVLDADGYTQVILSNGTYSYQVSAKDYHSESGEFIVSGAKVNKNISLKPAFGWLNIAASGTLKDATIYVDDTLVGNTPINRYQLSSGSHHIRIVKNLYLTYEDNITIQDSEELNYSATLTPDFATVTIMADSGCDIYVNDVFRGKSPWSGTLSTGTYIFEARKLGHRTTMLSKSITAVPAQQSYKLDSPTPIIGTINVSCTPVAADLYVDDKLVGQTPMMHDLLVGEHKVTLRKEGYSDKSLNVTVTEGNVEDLNVTLAKKTAINQEIKYTATKKISIKNTLVFGANITSHSWDRTTKIGVIKFDSEVTTIGYQAFRDCSSLISITIPVSVTSIGDYAFCNCKRLKSITIPNSVTSIGEAAFVICKRLKSITIPNSVTSIGERAFAWCKSLTSINIPSSVTNIGDAAFIGCSSLTSIYCKATTPPALDITAFMTNGSGRKIYVPRNSVNAYRSAEGWSYYAADIVGYDF